MINRHINKEFPLIVKALEFIAINPYKEFYLREFGKELKISPNTAQRFLDIFLIKGFLTESRKANLRFFKPNLNSNVLKHIKITFSLKEIEESEIIPTLQEANVSNLILFGSVAQGLDSKESDIDLIVISPNKEKIMKIVGEKENKFKRQINIQVFSWADWKNQKQKNKAFYQDVVSKGISLIGEIPILE